MSKRCAQEVSKAVAAEREACAKAACILCKHEVPLHGDYHIIEEIEDENREVILEGKKKIEPPIAIKCFGQKIRNREQRLPQPDTER